ncbi:MAG: class I SAM-dependent methyltransferase [Hyphomicrobiales bacterium]|nr:class I SAM-dependent methyltransferase [Hyphomicrobiales bacterium]
MPIKSIIIQQFKKPTGMLGYFAGKIMANRRSNITRNQWTVDLLEIEQHHQVLEIGCGPGVGLKAASKLITSGNLTGIDHSATMLNQAQMRMSSEIKAGLCQLHLGNIKNLSEFPDKYDRIYSANVVQFFPDRQLAFQNIYEALAPGGMVASTYQPRTNNPTRADAYNMGEEIKLVMKSCKFTNITLHELSLEPVPAICVTGNKQEEL